MLPSPEYLRVTAHAPLRSSAAMSDSAITIALSGPSGEPVNWARTLNSHGLTTLAPLFRRVEEASIEVTLAVGDGARTVVLAPAPCDRDRDRDGAKSTDPPTLIATVEGRKPCAQHRYQIPQTLRHMLCLDEDLSDFYGQIADDPQLAWARSGAGRLMRSPTVFEDVIKTLCTTNCAWSGTVRMVDAIVAELGAAAPGDGSKESKVGPQRRAFPSPAVMAKAPESFYRDIARAGYRGPYMRSIAEMVATGALDLEALAAASPDTLSDDELRARLEELPGVGPYASAHIMLLIGRRSFLVLDSWTRPTYARIAGRKASDKAIARRFSRYGDSAGLAFWLYVTQDWEDDGPLDKRR